MSSGKGRKGPEPTPAMRDGTEETHTRLDDVCGGLMEAISMFKERFENPNTGRLQKNLKCIAKLVKYQQCIRESDEADCQKLLPDPRHTLWAVAESVEILVGCNWLLKTDREDYLRWYIKGGAVGRLENPQSKPHNMENLCYQLFCGARLYHAGCVDIEIDMPPDMGKGRTKSPDDCPPDVAGTWEGRRVVMECKRISSTRVSQFRDVVEDANGQLCEGDLRIISADVSDAVYRSEFLERKRPWQEREIRGRIERRIDEMSSGLRMKLPGCDALLVDAAVPYAQRKEGPTSCRVCLRDVNKTASDFCRQYAANPVRKDNILLYPPGN